MREPIRAIVGDLARPFAIISTSFAASWATIGISHKVRDGDDGSIFIAAVFAGVGALYIGKAIEVFKGRKADAQVEIAKVSAVPPPGTATITAAPDVDVSVRDATDDGELPPEARLPK